MDVIVLLPDGVGVRNFVLGPLVNLLAAAGDVCLLHGISPDLVPVIGQGVNPAVRWEQMTRFREPILARVLRTTLGYAQMWWADTEAMRFLRQRPVRGSWRNREIHRAGRGCGRMLASPLGMKSLSRLHCQVGKLDPQVDHYRSFLKEFKPAVMFCSHQRPPQVLSPILAAKSLGIPTVTFIFSWDNLTSKGRIAAPFDHFLVWSDLMRQELLRFYPEVSRDRVHVVGTPQFDPYDRDELLWSRDVFFAQVGADPSRPLICYSGGDSATCPEDPGHLRILLELIRNGGIEGRPQVLLRPTPVDEGSRYNRVIEEFPEVLVARPEWIHSEAGGWSQVMPMPGDVQFLANLVAHSDLNINMASTMTLDFAIRDKPVVNIAFDVADPPPFGRPLWDFFYRFEHYRPVVELGAARFARSPEELAEHVNAYLSDPSLDRKARGAFVDLEVGVPGGTASQRIADVLESIG